MTLRDVITEILKSELFRLDYEKETKGYRIKLYEPNTQEFEYYDIHPSAVTNHKLFDYKDNFGSIELIKVGEVNGVVSCATQSEIKGIITVKGISNSQELNEKLNKLLYIYQNKPEEEKINV